MIWLWKSFWNLHTDLYLNWSKVFVELNAMECLKFYGYPTKNSNETRHNTMQSSWLAECQRTAVEYHKTLNWMFAYHTDVLYPSLFRKRWGFTHWHGHQKVTLTITFWVYMWVQNCENLYNENILSYKI
jgi:hypothetical protein